ncbi:MAG: hypothetical protein IPL95_13280 [Saprospiraceae bacterium]|nr:hypothetical protein [Saprospiraceae bacterium]
MLNLPNDIAGIAGEYFVAGELSKRGFNVSLTIRNSKGIDIHASKLENNKIFAIQVKTSKEKKAKWILNKKSETIYNQNFFYIFVLLNDINQYPCYYIVPSLDLANCIKKTIKIG